MMRLKIGETMVFTALALTAWHYGDAPLWAVGFAVLGLVLYLSVGD